ncbi:MAG: S41 family peptidase [Anaerolineales bacterium]|nr:S41 family peptidase [Anaerolineales bacterium]
MQNKLLRFILILFVAGVLVVGSFGGGFVAGQFLPLAPKIGLPLPQPPTATPLSPSTGGTPEELQTLFAPFWESWQLAHQYYVDQPLDDVQLMRGAIRGMLASLGDKHTSYMDPQEYSDATISISGEYEGIGAWVDTGGDYLTIVSPMPASPAEQAGLKTGDTIIAIDGEDMTGVPPEVARLKVLGPAGSTVILTIRRAGVELPLEFSITRATISVPSVEGKMLDGGIAYVQIFTFGDKTTPELKRVLTELMAQNPQGMIVDLRNNGGGYLVTAIEVASQFIGEGVIMYEQYGNGTRETYSAQPGGLATNIPLVVLVNGGTASASEIVAGAIQDYGRGKLVGVITYGKGSVQNWLPLANDQGAVTVTIAKWLTPKERHIQGIGLTPDVVVKRTDEDSAADRDPQLDAAIQLLLNP